MSLRDQAEIQRAHDILTAIVLGEVPILVDRERIIPALDALCWVLQHDHNTKFAENLAKIEAEIAKTGATLVDTGSPEASQTMSPEDAIAEGLIKITSQTLTIEVQGVRLFFTVTFPTPIMDPALLPNISITADAPTPFRVKAGGLNFFRG